MAHSVLTGAYEVAAGLGVWGIWLAIKGIWITVEYHLVDREDGTAVTVEESFELGRLRDFWRRRAELPRWRRVAMDAQIVIAAGVILGAVGSIVSLWWV